LASDFAPALTPTSIAESNNRRVSPAHILAISSCAPHKPGLACLDLRGVNHIERTNIVIDEKLMEDTLRVTGLKTKREAVELGLRTILRLQQQQELRKFRGKLRWEGDLDAMRIDK
jgi:Arc/MetJ family transcription regulator